MSHDDFQPPDGPTTEEAAELANTMPATLEEAYAAGRADEREELTRLLSWAYSKLAYRSFESLDDALAMDELKLILMGAPV